MAEMFLSCVSSHGRLIWDANKSGTDSEPTPALAPGGSGFLVMGAGGPQAPAGAEFCFLAAATTTTAAVNIYRVDTVHPRIGSNAAIGYTYKLACILTAISAASTVQPGVTGTDVLSTNYYAYSMTGGSAGTAGVDWSITNGSSGQVASVTVASKGCKWFYLAAIGVGSTTINAIGKAV